MTTRILWASFLATVLATPAAAETILALRDGDKPDLVSFDSSAPDTINGRLAISGLPSLPLQARPLAVEFRPTGGVYLLVQGLPTNTDCALYTVNTSSGLATPLGSTTFACAGISDADLDPRSDLMRVVTGTSNYRLSLGGFTTAGTKTAGTTAAFLPADVNAGAIPDIRALAYNQNVASAASTTLFGIDAGLDSLVRIGAVDGNLASADAGQVATIGSLGAAFASGAFDISGASGVAWLFARDTAAVPSINGFYSVDLATGAATLVGKVGNGSFGLLGLTAVPGTLYLPPPENATPINDGGALPLPLLGVLVGLGVWRRRRRAA